MLYVMIQVPTVSRNIRIALYTGGDVTMTGGDDVCDYELLPWPMGAVK